MGVGPKAVVAAPLSVASPINLLQAARTIDEDDERWENGLTFSPENCSGAGIADPCATDEEKIIQTSPGAVEFEPFEVWAGDKCSTFQFQTRSWQDRARRLLEAALPKQVEREFWTGEKSVDRGWGNAYLADGTSTLIISDASPRDALACLERAIGDCGVGGRGMIHATSDIVTLWAQEGMVRRESKLILTIKDTIVVPGSGYPGTGPGDVPAQTERSWAYATGMVEVRLGPVRFYPDRLADGMDRALNLVEFRAERTASVVWDQCCHLAAEVVVPNCQRLVS